MLFSAERKDAAEDAGEQTLIGARSDRQNKRRETRRDLDLLRRDDSGQVQRFYPGQLKEGAIYFCAAERCFRVAVRLN